MLPPKAKKWVNRSISFYLRSSYIVEHSSSDLLGMANNKAKVLNVRSIIKSEILNYPP